MIFQAIGKKKERDIEALTFAMLTSYADQSMHESLLESFRAGTCQRTTLNDH